jgi:hypothetical protein
MEARCNRRLIVPGVPGGRAILGERSSVGLYPRVPKLDVESIDLLDEHQNRAPDGGGLLTARFPKPLAPTPKRLELFLVQAHAIIVTDGRRYCRPTRLRVAVRPQPGTTKTRVIGHVIQRASCGSN